MRQAARIGTSSSTGDLETLYLIIENTTRRICQCTGGWLQLLDMLPFGDVLARHLADADLSQREFAKRTKTPLSTINAVVKGGRKPPKRRLSVWANTLGLTGKQHDVFVVAGFLTHAPASLVTACERLFGVAWVDLLATDKRGPRASGS